MTHSPGELPMLLIEGLRDPRSTLQWPLQTWEGVVRMSRRLRLLARLATALEQAGALGEVPTAVRRHLIGDHRLSDWRLRAMTWALRRIGDSLIDVGQPLVLLKGAAYVAQGLPISAGRMPSDLDILVPQRALGAVVPRLQAQGWSEVALDDHDQRYYRDFSHELPPMRHPTHPIELDLHHNILPPVARTTVDADLLLSRLVPSGAGPWMTLHPVDQVLHSAAHLFLDSEARNRFRDLVDLDGLLRHFPGQHAGFWDELPQRAVQLGLAEPLALATHFCATWLQTPLPATAHQRIVAGGPGPLRRQWLLPLLGSLLTPTPPDRTPPRHQDLAALVFLTRYHYNRMPMKLLVPHLWHKWRGRQDDAADAPPPTAP